MAQGNSKPVSHLPDSHTILQPCSGPPSGKVAHLSSWGYAGVVQYFTTAAAYKEIRCGAQNQAASPIVHVHHMHIPGLASDSPVENTSTHRSQNRVLSPFVTLLNLMRMKLMQ